MKKYFKSEETSSYSASDGREAALQVFANVFKLFNRGITESEFQMDEELDTEAFWRTFARKCAENNFDYYIVHKDKNFDEVYYTVELIDIEEPDESYD